MAQLIKLQDYVTRYEWNPFHYPTQFIRLKRQNWNKLREQWEDGVNGTDGYADKTEDNLKNDENAQRMNVNESNAQHDNINLLKSEEQLVQYFLDKLFPFQMKWATSTVSHLSYTDQQFYFDNTLKYFLQRFPDIYLVMYYPIFSVKQTPVEGEVILISPIGIELIKLIEKSPDVTIVASNERIWTIETANEIKKELSPLISLRRTEHIVNSILNKYNIEFPIHKTVLSRTNHVLHATEPYNTNIIGKLDYSEWFKQKRQLSAPLKSEQLKAMEALLLHCQTTSIKRPEWEEDDDRLLYVDED